MEPSTTTPSQPPSKLVELFGIDRRSLACFRIGMGAMLLADLAKRAIELRAHYTDAGVAPRHLIEALPPRPPLPFRAYFLTGETWGPVLWFSVAAIAALCVVVGYRTRLASFVSVVLLASVQFRNPFACHTGDAYLGALVFWLPFLPLGDTFSIDRLRRPDRPRLPERYLSMATFGVLLQALVFYVMAGVYKEREPVWTSGEALSVFVGLEAYGRPFAAFLGEHPSLSKFFTYFTLALELGGPLLLIFPTFSTALRLIVVALLAGFHLGIQFTVYIGIFEILSIAALVIWLPSWFWNVAVPKLSPAGLRRAAARLAARYDTPSADAPWRRPSKIGAVLLLVPIVLMLTYNVRRYQGLKTHLPLGLGPIAHGLNLKQSWDIFAGIERRREGWFLVDGRLEDDSHVNLLTGEPITTIEEHAWAPTVFANHNMRRWYINMLRLEYPALRGAWAEYLTRCWNEEQARKCTSVKVWHIGSRPWLDRDANAVELVSWEPLVVDP